MAGVGRRSCCAGPAAALWGLPPKARGAVEFRTAHSARSARHCAAPTLAPAGAVCLFWFAPRLRWSPPVAHHVVSCWASPPALTDSGATGSLRPAGPGGLRLPVAPARVSGLTWKEEGRRRRRRVGDGAREGARLVSRSPICRVRGRANSIKLVKKIYSSAGPSSSRRHYKDEGSGPRWTFALTLASYPRSTVGK